MRARKRAETAREFYPSCSRREPVGPARGLRDRSVKDIWKRPAFPGPTYLTKNPRVPNPDLLSYLLALLARSQGAGGPWNKAVIVIDRKNAGVPLNSLISFLSPSWSLFRVLTVSCSHGRSTTMPLCLALLPQFLVAWLARFFLSERRNWIIAAGVFLYFHKYPRK